MVLAGAEPGLLGGLCQARHAATGSNGTIEGISYTFATLFGAAYTSVAQTGDGTTDLGKYQ